MGHRLGPGSPPRRRRLLGAVVRGDSRGAAGRARDAARRRRRGAQARGHARLPHPVPDARPGADRQRVQPRGAPLRGTLGGAAVRILVLSDLYPPVAFGGYELDCQSFVEGLRERHDILVLTSDLRADEAPAEAHVRRELPWAGCGRVRETASSATTALRAAKVVRLAVADFEPD